jgi:Domain of unknown function (DUF3859)
MARFFLALVLLVFAAGTAGAQQTQRVEVYEFGTYAANGLSYAQAPSGQGIKIEGHDGYTHLETTRTISAQLGARFGFRYRVVGTPPGVYAPLKMVWKFPPPGIIGSDPSHPVQLEIVEFDAAANDNYVITMSLESLSDLVAGTWTLEIWSGDEKLTEQNFEVLAPLIS